MDFDEVNMRQLGFEHAVGHVLGHHMGEMVDFIRGGISEAEFLDGIQQFVESVREWHVEFTHEDRRMSGYDDVAPPTPSDLPVPF